MAFLEIDKLSAFYGRAQSLHDVSFSVEKGAIIAVIGTNGAGKSTLMDSIMGMVTNTGAIRLEGQDLVGRKSSQIVRMGVGYAPERAHLFAYMSVEDNLLVGGYTARGDVGRNIAHVHELFPVLNSRATQETATLSGGERQMVSVGRALMTSPRLLLVDEPTIGLSPKVCTEIAATLRRLNDEEGLTILITEQNINFAMELAEEVHVLETGRLRISGAPKQLAEDPELKRAYFGE
jgi:branched-chain amino acid transport system ATP-binding protein